MESGFDRQEALDLLAMSAIIENGGTPPIPNPPAGWASRFVSPEIGPFKNKWQLWRRGETGPHAVAIRGTVADAGSILEDVVSLMVRATGTLSVGSVTIPYSFAEDPEAGVHLGFALATLLLLHDPDNGILAQLPRQGIAAGSAIFITGHSQGAAMATLLRSYLRHGPEAPEGNIYKTYVFAQPKPGNTHYAEDFESRFCNAPWAFRITNSLDWVPEVPFTLQFVQDIDKPNPLSVLASPSLIVSLMSRALADIHDYVEQHARARLQTTAVALAQTKTEAPAAAGPALMAQAFQVPVMASLNFVNVGTDLALMGTPCVDAQCQDAFFEHHATTYYSLLQAQIPVPSPGSG